MQLCNVHVDVFAGNVYLTVNTITVIWPARSYKARISKLVNFSPPLVYPQVMQLSGIDGEQIVLLLEDHQVDPSFLELINSLLSAGEVPGLYTPEELEPLLGPLRDLASQDGFRGTLVSYFASRVLRNLHIVLIMDSSSKNFTANCESNPAFYKNCSFQWMQGWSKESMAQSEYPRRGEGETPM